MMGKKTTFVILGTIILSYVSFYNKFPLLTANSGDYVNSGFKRLVPEGHAVMYGLFLAHTSWAVSIWLTVFSQALLLSLVVFYCFRHFTSNANYQLYYLAFIFFISFIMAASVSASTIAPAVFAGISILSLSLLLFAENLVMRDIYVIGAIAVISTSMSTTHLISALLVLLFFAVGLIKTQPIVGSLTTSPRRVVISFAVMFVSAVWILAANFAVSGGFSFLNDSFLREHLSASGALGEDNFLSGVFELKRLFFIPDYPRIEQKPEILEPISAWFSWEFREGLLSQQYGKGLGFNFLSYTQTASSIASAIICLRMLFGKGNIKYNVLFRFTMLSFIALLSVNTFLSPDNNADCWQFGWLLALPIFIYVSEFGFGGKKPIRSS